MQNRSDYQEDGGGKPPPYNICVVLVNGGSKLKEIFIPASVTKKGYYAFSGDDNLVIHCYRNSAAHKYAVDNEIKFKLLDGTSPEIKKGDFDGDSYYDVNELVVMQKRVAGWRVTFADEQEDET